MFAEAREQNEWDHKENLAKIIFLDNQDLKQILA